MKAQLLKTSSLTGSLSTEFREDCSPTSVFPSADKSPQMSYTGALIHNSKNSTKIIYNLFIIISSRS